MLAVRSLLKLSISDFPALDLTSPLSISLLGFVVKNMSRPLTSFPRTQRRMGAVI